MGNLIMNRFIIYKNTEINEELTKTYNKQTKGFQYRYELDEVLKPFYDYIENNFDEFLYRKFGTPIVTLREEIIDTYLNPNFKHHIKSRENKV